MAVPQGKNGEPRLGKQSLPTSQSSRDSLPQSPSVLRELSLTRGGRDERDVFLLRKVVEADGVHGRNGGGQATQFSAVRQPLCYLLGLAAIRTVENEERRCVDIRKEVAVSLFGAILSCLLYRLAQTADEFRGELGFGCSKLGKVVLTIQELFEVILDRVGIERKRIVALSFFGRVPSVEGPVSGVDGQFRLLEDLENGSVLCEIREVGEDDARAVELVRLDQRLEHLRVRRV